MPAKINTGKQTGFYGILNGLGDFWTPLAFTTPEKARQHIIDFWGTQTDMRDKCLRTHKIVPVRIQLTEIPHPGARQ